MATRSGVNDATAPYGDGTVEKWVQAEFSLKYNGPAVDAGRMDVYAAAANMIAFSEFMVAAVKVAYGEQAHARAEVAGHGRGSFLTDLVINVGGPAATLIGSGLFKDIAIKDLYGLVKEVFVLWKHLKGSPPKDVAQVQQNVNVTNNNGQILNVSINALHLVYSDKSTEATGKFIRDALSADGMDSVTIGTGRRQIARVTQAEAKFFVPVTSERPLSSNAVRMSLIIEAAVFKDGNKWRFHDGSTQFFADIADDAFLGRVANGEQFGRGDILDADLVITQTETAGRISSDRSVIKVHEHRSGSKQHKFPFSGK